MNQQESLSKLLEGWLDGGLSQTEESQLLRQLKTDPQLRRHFAEQVALLGATRAASDKNPRWLAIYDLIADEQSSFECATMDRIDDILAPRSFFSRNLGWAIAATVTLLISVAVLLNRPKSQLVESPPQAPNSDLPQAPSVAVVIGTSPESTLKVGAELQPGVITQSNGWLTVQNLKGVSVTFDAPFEAVFSDHERIALKKGKARVHVPPGAEGFRLETPTFNIVDLGTEFGAVVHPNGTGTCRVFDGLAEVHLLDSVGETKRTRRLTKSTSVRIDPARQTLAPLIDKDEDYNSLKLPSRPKLRLPQDYANQVINLTPDAYWRFESVSNGLVINETPGKFHLQVGGAAKLVPEDGGNHSGDLSNYREVEYFQIPKAINLISGDFTISMFAQFDWLQNFALLSAMRYDQKVQGHPFILQSYGALSRPEIKGTTLYAVFRDPPAWNGGIEILGTSEIRPLRWHHIAASRENDICTLYLDGKAIASQTIGNKPLDCRQIYLGRLNANPKHSRPEARGLVGRVDELAIFSKALSATQIHRISRHEN